MQRVLHVIQDFSDEDSDDDDNEKEGFKKFRKILQATIYLIDARKKMFVTSSDEEESPFLRCLKCVRNAIRSKIFRLEKCFCSIILLGTEKCENALKVNNITTLKELKLLESDHVLKIDEIIKVVENSSFEKEYGHDLFSLGDAFWLSSHIFNEKSKRIKKSIVLFTNDDNPGFGQNDCKRSITNAEDMFKNFISFKLIPIGEDFDTNKFYKKILQAAQNDNNCTIPKPVTTENEMLKMVTEVKHNQASLAKLPFIICDDFKIEVVVHYLVRKVKPPFKVKLSKATNEKVVTKMQLFNEETGSLVKNDDVIKSQEIGLKDVYFRLSELKEIYNIGDVGLKLLGFKPASTVRLENYVKPCAFIYPDDSMYKGSSVFFTALLKRCIAKQVVPICTFCPKQSACCRFVALMAQDEYLGSDQSQESPPGFVVFFLPFVEELRPVDDVERSRADPEQVEIATKLIKKLKFNYKPECFQNPKLKTHWAAIEALALDLKEPEEVNDCTLPNRDLIARRTGKIAEEFIKAVYPEDYDPECFTQPRKRKVENRNTEFDAENVEETIRNGNGERLSNDVLKSYLVSVGEGKNLSKIKKADLIKRIQKHLGMD